MQTQLRALLRGLLFRCARLVECVVQRQLRRHLRVRCFQRRKLNPRCFQRFLRCTQRLHPVARRRLLLRDRLQLCTVGGRRFGLRPAPGQLLVLLFQLGKRGCGRGNASFVVRQQFRQQRLRFGKRQFSGVGAPHVECTHVRVAAHDPADELAQAALRFGILRTQPGGRVFEPQLQGLEPLGLEDLAEDPTAFVRFGCQQLAEIALRQHRNLHKLIPIHAQNQLDLRLHVARAREDASVRQVQLGGRFFFRFAGAALGGARVFRVAPHGIFRAAVRERQRHIRRRFGAGVLRPQHFRLAVVAAGRAVQRIGDRVEHRRFARAGVAGN